MVSPHGADSDIPDVIEVLEQCRQQCNDIVSVTVADSKCSMRHCRLRTAGLPRASPAPDTRGGEEHDATVVHPNAGHVAQMQRVLSALTTTDARVHLHRIHVDKAFAVSITLARTMVQGLLAPWEVASPRGPLTALRDACSELHTGFLKLWEWLVRRRASGRDISHHILRLADPAWIAEVVGLMASQTNISMHTTPTYAMSASLEFVCKLIASTLSNGLAAASLVERQLLRLLDGVAHGGGWGWHVDDVQVAHFALSVALQAPVQHRTPRSESKASECEAAPNNIAGNLTTSTVSCHRLCFVRLFVRLGALASNSEMLHGVGMTALHALQERGIAIYT